MACMHRIKRRCFFLLWLLVSGFTHGETVTIKADYWYPYNGEPNSPQPGYMIELAQLILEPLGFTVEYRQLNWQRALSSTLIGTTDCVVGATKKEAPNLVFAQLPWGVSETQVYVRHTDPWRYHDLESFTGRKTGLILGYIYGEELDGYFQTHKGELFDYISGDNPMQQNIHKLMAGRIDGLLETEPVMDATLTKLGLSTKIIKAGVIGETEALYLACNGYQARSQQIVRLVNEHMPTLFASQRFTQLLEKYGIESWQ